MKELIEAAIKQGTFPGAAWAVIRGQEIIYDFAGRHTYCPESPNVDEHTIWDLASVSKVMATTTVAMNLLQDGGLKLNAPVASVLPEFGAKSKEHVTFLNLLVHDSGLAAFRNYVKTHTKSSEVVEAVLAEPLEAPTGTKTVYSDLGLITLGKALEKLGGSTLDDLAARYVFSKVGGVAGYNPKDRQHCAPTEPVESWRREIRKLRGLPEDEPLIQGEVHDPNAFLLEGVAGHAGVFANLQAVAEFARLMLDPPALGVSSEIVSLFTTKHSSASSRALGWDTKSPTGSSAGTKFGPKSFGHTGFTGTSIWIDPEREFAAVLLTNRVHPTADNPKIIAFRPCFHDAISG